LTVDWTPGVVYQLLLTVKLMFPQDSSSWDGSSASAEYAIIYSRTPALARISGGSRTAGTLDHLVVDASSSYNPDVAEQARDAAKDLLFCWSCVTPHGDCGWTPPDESSPTWTIHHDKLGLSHHYHVSVKVKAAGGSCGEVSDDDPLADTATVIVTTMGIEGRPPLASIMPLDAQFLDYSQPVRMSGDVFSGNCHQGAITAANCEVEYEWTFEPSVQGFSSQKKKGYGLVSLQLGAGMLERDADQFYTIRLSATSSDGSMIGTSEISVQVNIGPEGGTFKVTPTEGAAMDTNFVLQCGDWTDTHVPLQYEFRAKSYSQVCKPSGVCETTSTPASLGGAQMSKSKENTLPAGDPANNDKMELEVFIIDALGSTTRMDFMVKVEFVPNIPVLIAKATAEFNSALSAGDLSAASTQLSLFGSLIGHRALAGVAMKSQADNLRASLGKLVGQFFGAGGRRRRRNLLALSPDTCDSQCVDGLYSYTYLGKSSGDDLTIAECTPAFTTISTKFSSASSIGTSDENKKTMADFILEVVGKCQHHTTHATYSMARDIIDYVGVLLMKGKGSDESQSYQQFGSTEKNNFFVTFHRFASIRSQVKTVNALTGVGVDSIEVKIPQEMTDPGNGGMFDIQVVLFGKMVNPYRGTSNTTLNSRIFVSMPGAQ